jgi:hypothetical protein
MHDNCSHCGLKYQIEPSFFYGAMYVSYGLNVAVGIAAFIISFIIFGYSLKVAFINNYHTYALVPIFFCVGPETFTSTCLFL